MQNKKTAPNKCIHEQRIQQIMYAISHDLQEPLRMINSYLKLVETKYPDKIDPKVMELLGFAFDGGQRMSNMLQGILSFTRVDSQGNPFTKLNLQEITSEIVSVLGNKIEETNAKVTFDHELPNVYGDYKQIMTLMNYTINNALKFVKEGTQPVVNIGCIESGDFWQIYIRDNGIGIVSKYKDTIFDIFSKLNPVQEYPGAGMGLAVSRRIVERHGGNIWIENNESGTGSSINFALPKSEKK